MIDAPVSGGTGRAQSGELSVIVGGDAAVVAKCKDLFDVMGSQTFHVGPLGSGLAMKLVNNMLVQVNTVAVAEAMVLGVKAGLDPQDDLRRGARLDRRQCGVGAAGAAHPRGRLRAGRHDRHLLQGPGARDRLRQAPGRAAAARERHPAGLPDGPRPGAQQAGRLGDREGVREAGRRDGEEGRADNDHVRFAARRLSGRLDLEPGRRPAAGAGPSGVRADPRRLRRAQARRCGAGITTETHAEEVARAAVLQRPQATSCWSAPAPAAW